MIRSMLMSKWYRWIFTDLLYCLRGSDRWSSFVSISANREITKEDMVDIVESVKNHVTDLKHQLVAKEATIINLRAQLDNVERGSVILESALEDYKSRR